MATESVLSEQDRNKLDAIVMRMTVEKESEDTIRAVVGDFKAKYARPRVPAGLERFSLPYQQTPEGRGVAERYGVLPSQLQEARNIVRQDIVNIPQATAQTAVRAAPAVAGAMIGSGLGPAGTLAGAGLGYSIGGRLAEAMGLEQPPATVQEALGRAAEDVGMGAAQEAGGQVVGKVYQGILAPRAGRVTPQGEQLRSTLRKADVEAAVTDVAPGRGLRTAEAFAEKQIGGGRIYEQAERELQAMHGNALTGEEGWLAKEARRVSGAGHQLDASRVARGETIQAGLKDIATTNRELGGIEWDAVQSFDTGVPDFGIENLRGVMRQKMAQRGALKQLIEPQTSARLTSTGGRVVKTGEATARDVVEKGIRLETGEMMPTTLGGMYEHGITATPPRTLPGGRETFVTERAIYDIPETRIVEGLARNEGPVTLEQARAGRRALGKLYENDPKEWGGALKALHEDLEAYATKNPAAVKAYKEAKQAHIQNVVPFEKSEPLGRLIDKNEPIAIVREFMQPRDARITLLRAAANQTGKSGPVWEAIRSEGVTQVLEDPRILQKLGPETQKLLFTPEQRAFFDEVKNWVQTSSAFKKTGIPATGRGVGKNEFAQTGGNVVALEGFREGVRAAGRFATIAIGGTAAATGGMGGAVAGTVIAVSPNVIARILSSPQGARWLTEGIKTPAGTAQGLRIASQLIPAYMKAVGEERGQGGAP